MSRLRPVAAEPTFVEKRPMWRGMGTSFGAVIGCAVVAITLLLGGLWIWPARIFFCAGGLALVVPAFLTAVTEVAGTTLTITVAPFWHRQVEVDDIVGAEIVWVDHLVAIFGGWTTRQSLVGALAATVEGDRSVGNRAVRLELRTGGVVQVGSWRPHALLRAIEEAQAR